MADQVVRWTIDGNFQVAHLAGEIDMANAGEIFDAVGQGLEGGVLIVDLSAVTFINSSGLGELVRLILAYDVRLVSPAGHARRVLEVSGIDAMVSVYNTVDAAKDTGDHG